MVGDNGQAPHELLTGQVVPVVSGYSGYATGTSTILTDYISAQMRADWQANRAMLRNSGHRANRTRKPFPTTRRRGCAHKGGQGVGN